MTDEQKAFYIFDRNKFIKNFTDIRKTFLTDFPVFSIGYSFKTNNCPLVLKAALNSGCYAEVVSPEEYSLALKNGFSKDKIIYNGVCKDFDTIKDCLSGGGTVNIDNEEDLDHVIKAASLTQIKGRIGLRINFDAGNNIKSHFGVKTDTTLYHRIVKLDKEGLIKIKGLHCHFTHSRECESWKIRAQKMCLYSKDFNHIEFLDFGGNMYSMSTKNLMADYSRIIACEVNNAFEIFKPEVIIECGTPLIHDAFDLVCNVKHIKDNWAITDASIFDLGTENARGDNCRILVINKSPEKTKRTNITVTGYTCMENDILKKSYTGYLDKGDQIIFKNCGSYSYSWANSFIKSPLEVKEK